jgi:23S rRNA A2030 N6-methylase RlmJ
MDERFVGWGGEDISFMIAVDTLYAPHRTTRNGVLHLWHPHKGTEHFDRMWEGQEEPGANNALSTRYADARALSRRMHILTREPGTGEPVSS